MDAPDAIVDDVAGAVLDGAPLDWPALQSQAGEPYRALLEELRTIAILRSVTHAPAADPESKPEQWGHLRVLDPIGRGAFGEVYRAWDTRLDREVALKLLPADPRDDRAPSSIIEEGRLLARVQHPNVVTIYGAERIGDRIGLWMELVKGQTLEQVLQDGRTFTPADVIALGTQVCHAVAAVHEAGLLHRDIKAQNVVVGDDGRVVLMDFGTGRERGDPSSEVAGTPLYLAPELLDGGAATIQSDLYSVGVLLYHLLTNAFPVRAKGLRELREAHRDRERSALASMRPGVSSKLTRVVERALAADPALRHDSADALARDLARLAPRSGLVRLAHAGAVAAGVLLVVWAGWEVRGRQTGSTSPTRATLARWFPGGVPIANPIDHPVIAVLPLENLSAEPDTDYFADGLTEELIRILATVDGLEVKSKYSAFSFKDKPRNPRDVGDQLGVNLVVEGSVLRAGSQLRVIARLIQVDGDRLLWSHRFDGKGTDILAIQDQIANAIATNLRLKLGARQRRYDVDPETYDLYLRARSAVERRGSASSKAAAQLFQQVIARDPRFAPAYAGLADAYAFMSTDLIGLDPHKALPMMREAGVKALDLDPLLAEGHAAMGLVYSRELQWDNAEASFRRALDLNPSLTQTYTNYSISTLLPLRKFSEAEALLQVALRYDPKSLSVRRELGLVLICAGRYEEALEYLQAVHAVAPDFLYVKLHLARALTFAGRLSEALPIWDAWRAEPGRRFWAAHPYVLAGRRAEVESWLDPQDYALRRAVIYLGLGDVDRAFEELDRAVITNPERVVRLLAMPDVASLHGDARLAALRRRLKLP